MERIIQHQCDEQDPSPGAGGACSGVMCHAVSCTSLSLKVTLSCSMVTLSCTVEGLPKL
jgi:hypothetical protein